MLSTVAHRLRPLLTGLIVLVFSAGVAFAAKPSTPPGRPDASHGPAASSPAASPSASGGQNKANEQEPTESPEAETDTQEGTDSANDNCSTNPTGLTADQLSQLTHGQIVCWAAHQSTPPEFANHGAWVSHWAKGNHGSQSSNRSQ